jgi:YbbR domain-containing protein
MNLNDPKKRTIGLKIASILMAVLLWFYVVNQGSLTATQSLAEVKLRFYNLAEGYAVKAPETVSVRIWGPVEDASEIIAFVDLSGIGAGSFSLPVNIEPVRGALFVSVEPKEVMVEIEAVSERQVPIIYEISQPPPPGYKLIEVITIPDKCLIRGTQYNVENLKAVCSINLSNTRDIDTFTLPLSIRDVSGNVIEDNIKIVPATVLVYTVVSQEFSTKKVKVVPDIASSEQAELRIARVEVLPEYVTIAGTAEAIKGVNQISTEKIMIDSNMEYVVNNYKVVAPAGLSVYPSVVNVNIELTTNSVIEE